VGVLAALTSEMESGTPGNDNGWVDSFEFAVAIVDRRKQGEGKIKQ
jgi:hypothetical protein